MNSKLLITAGVLLVLATLLIDSVNSANILVIAFWSTKSHKITYMPLVEELGKRGHNLTVVTPIKPMKELKNVKEIFTIDVERIIKRHDMNPITERDKGADFSKWTDLCQEVCNESYDVPEVKALLKEKFDLVIYQPIFNECLLGLIYRLQAPFVGFTPLGAPHWTLFKTGTYLASSINPNFVLSYPLEMNFGQRFLNFGMDRMIDVFNALRFEPMSEQVYREKLGQDIPSVQEILNNCSLTLSNSHFSLSGPSRAYLPDVVDVGGIHSHPAKTIPKDLEDFIGKGKDGFILFSMGSVIKAHMVPEEKRKMILGVFSKLKQQILWKWDEETMPGLPKNVKLSSWLPQQDLLGHPDIKMFITHCGGGSTEESIYHGVPLVGIPIWGDQIQNANQAKKHNFIVELEWDNLSEETLGGAIQEILENPKYRTNAKKISTLFKDRPMDPLEQGIYWLEYVLRHKGAPHLRSAGRKLNVLQYHSYDVILAYLAIIGGILLVIFSVLRLVCRKLCCRSGNNLKNDVTSRKKQN